MTSKLLTVAYKSFKDLVLGLLCELIVYQFLPHSFFLLRRLSFRFHQPPRSFWSHVNFPKTFPWDLILHLPPSRAILEVVQDITVPMGFCSLVFYQAPAIDLLLDRGFFFFFLSEGLHRISSETIDLNSCPDPESSRHLSCPATHGWFYLDWEANQM